MFRKLLNPDNGLMIVMTQITDCIFLSLFWLLGCFPLVTAGASCAALYDGVYYAYRRGDKHSWRRFLNTFKGSFKSSLLPTALMLAALIGGGWGLIQLWNGAVSGAVSWMTFSAAAVGGILVLGMVSVLFAMLSRFENTTPALLKNTLLLSLAQLPRTLCLGVLQAAAGFLCIRFLLPLFFLPALTALVETWFIEPMFRPFLPQEEPEEA